MREIKKERLRKIKKEKKEKKNNQSGITNKEDNQALPSVSMTRKYMNYRDTAYLKTIILCRGHM